MNCHARTSVARRMHSDLKMFETPTTFSQLCALALELQQKTGGHTEKHSQFLIVPFRYYAYKYANKCLDIYMYIQWWKSAGKVVVVACNRRCTYIAGICVRCNLALVYSFSFMSIPICCVANCKCANSSVNSNSNLNSNVNWHCAGILSNYSQVYHLQYMHTYSSRVYSLNWRQWLATQRCGRCLVTKGKPIFFSGK